MAKENVENLRLMYEAFNRRDFDGALQYFDPEVEFYPGILPPDQDADYLGRQGVREWLVAATESWVAVTVEPKERRDIASDRFLMVDRWLFRGRDGIEIEQELPTAFTFRNGLIVRVDGFTDKADALEATGLSE
jgi:ketosteroid isomerase-like protein